MAITQAQREKFIRDVTPAADAASRATGIDRNVIIAQAAHESAWGTKAKGNNYFGIKGKGQSFMTTEVINGKTVKMKQGFRTYASPMESFMDWANLMTSKARYAPVINAATPEAQIAALGASGYATDPKYASKLSSITARVKGMAGVAADLLGFDGAIGIQGAVGNRTIKPGMRGEDVRALQSMLKGMGADVGVDGIYGPDTQKAVETFQQANGLKVDGIIGARTRPMLVEAATGASPADNLAPPGIGAAPRMPSRIVTPQGLRLSGMADEYARRAALASAPTLTGSVEAGPDVGAETRMSLSPVSYHSAPKRVLTATTGFGIGPTPAGAAINRNNRTPLDYANEAALKAAEGIDYRASLASAPRQLASTADNLAPSGIGPASIGAGVSAKPAGVGAEAPRISAVGANSPFAEPSFTNRGLPPGAQASPQQVADAKRKLGLELAASAPQRTTIGNPAGIDMAARRRIDPRIMQDAMETAAARQALATQADNAAPPHIGPTPANALASRQAAPIAPRMVRTESIPQNVLTVSGATARPAAPDPQAMQRTFDIMSNYQPSAAPKTDLSAIFDKVQAPSLPSRTVPTPQVSAVSGAPLGTTDIPASMSAGYPKLSPALTAPQAAQAARYNGLAAQYQQQQTLAAAPKVAPPTYQPTSPLATAPTLDEIAYNNGLPVQSPMAATAAPAPPPSAFQKLAPGMISMAMASTPMGILGGFARLAAASLGNVNNPRGLGYDAGVAARNAAVARGVQASDLVGNGASYGRRQSDGTVTGTTSRGTGYTSSGGGDRISVGGRSYSKDSRGHYSLDL